MHPTSAGLYQRRLPCHCSTGGGADTGLEASPAGHRQSLLVRTAAHLLLSCGTHQSFTLSRARVQTARWLTNGAIGRFEPSQVLLDQSMAVQLGATRPNSDGAYPGLKSCGWR